MTMTLEADFCTLELPDGWLRLGPLRFTAAASAESLAGEVEEVWLEGEAPSVGDYLEERKAFLSRCFEAFEVLAEGPVEAGGPRAHGLTLRFENDDFQPTIHREVVLAEGPVRCSLRLSGPEDAPDREALFDRIVRSFQLTTGRFLGAAEPFSLFGEPERSFVTDPRIAVEAQPLLCHRLAVPRDWSCTVEGREVVLGAGRSEIRIRRLLGDEREAGKWMVSQLEKLEATGSRLLGTGQGSTPRGASSALWSESGSGTWRTAATQRQLVFRLATEEPLEFTVRGSLRQPVEVEPLLGPLIGSLEPLDSESWLTRPLEPWLDLTLEGPWTCIDLGLYVHPELFIPVLELRQQRDAPPLETLKSSLHEALRQGAGVLPGSNNEVAEMGQFRGREAWRYRADAQLSIRGIWVADGSTLTSCLLQTRDGASADAVFLKILEGLRLPETLLPA